VRADQLESQTGQLRKQVAISRPTVCVLSSTLSFNSRIPWPIVSRPLIVSDFLSYQSISFVIVNQWTSSTTWPYYIIFSVLDKIREISNLQGAIYLMYQILPWLQSIYKWKSKGWFPILRDELWNGINYTSCALHGWYA